MKKFLNSFCAVFVLAACLLVTGCKAPSGGGGSGTTHDIVTFGSFPQSLKADGVTIEAESKTAGSYTYFKGSDGEWYANLNSKYYKVEPIKWRVLTTNYDHDGNPSTAGKKLLLAENILINKAYHTSSNNYENSSVRAYLTGDFYATAFTQEEQNAIATTTVINNARSTNPDGNATEWSNGANQYASDDATCDKIFLLSAQEATKADYGFGAYDEFKGDGIHDDSTRIRMTTAFAKDSGATQYSTAGYGGSWWLRSPVYANLYMALAVIGNGYMTGDSVDKDFYGVVPALCLN